jgi:hypothetical protein
MKICYFRVKEMNASLVTACVGVWPLDRSKDGLSSWRPAHCWQLWSRQQVKAVGDQRSRTASGAALFQNRLQAINEIVTLLVVIEDFAVFEYTRNATIHRVAKSDAL